MIPILNLRDLTEDQILNRDIRAEENVSAAVDATIAAVRTMPECQRLVFAFQPHTYTRTAALFDDFVTQLKRAELLILAEIFAAREKNTIGISSADLAKEIPGALFFPTFERLETALKLIAQPGDVIFTVGAGDVYKVGEDLLKSE